MKNFHKSIFLFIFCLLFLFIRGELKSQTGNLTPFVGAQVFIEPGHTPEEIDSWFRIMKENNMTVCNIRLFESYMHKADSTWDFTLFDYAFKSAEKYGIKVFSTIFPATEKTDIGGFKNPRNDAHLESIAQCIKQLTIHFSQFPSLYAWVLMNEPGIVSTSGSEFSLKKFNEWKQSHSQKEFTDKGFPVLANLSQQSFLLDYNTWYLNWITNEIKKYDTKHELHVNPHAIFQMCPIYNFVEWRKFLTILGGSAHAAWHFGYFSRRQYGVAMSANCEILRSGAGNLPWMITEMQGGNNTYSGALPLCPTKEEIAQWLWIVMASEGKGSIFWTLNPCTSGRESGEWGLLDFQDQPSDRMIAASKVAETFRNHEQFFSKAKETESGINVLYIRESFWVETMMAKESILEYEARRAGGVMKSALGYYEALCEMGVNAGLKAFEEFDFSKPDYKGQTIILANQISVPNRYAENLERFVNKGGKLIVDGLTAYYDENLHNTMNTGWPFEKLMGGNISEFKLIDNLFTVKLKDINIPAHFMRGLIANSTGEVIASFDGVPIAIRNKFGIGEVLWIPSLIGLGSRIQNNYVPLITLLNKETQASLTNVPFRFKTSQKNMLMKTLQSGDSYITVIINKAEEKRKIELYLKNSSLKPDVLYADKQGKVTGRIITIAPEETVVVEWK